MPASMTARHIEDPLLIKVRYAIREDKWADLEQTVFKAVRDELWVIGQIVMKGSRIVLPQKMQRRALILAHEGHQGVRHAPMLDLERKCGGPEWTKTLMLSSETVILVN